MRLAMGRSGRIQRLSLLLLLVVLISAGVSGKPQQGAAAGAGEESPDGDYGENYDEYNPVDYEPEYEEGTLSKKTKRISLSCFAQSQHLFPGGINRPSASHNDFGSDRKETVWSAELVPISTVTTGHICSGAARTRFKSSPSLFYTSRGLSITRKVLRRR